MSGALLKNRTIPLVLRRIWACNFTVHQAGLDKSCKLEAIQKITGGGGERGGGGGSAVTLSTPD